MFSFHYEPHAYQLTETTKQSHQVRPRCHYLLALNGRLMSTASQEPAECDVQLCQSFS